MTIPFVLVDQFYFCMLQPIRLDFSEKFIFELDLSSYSFKITCILLRQVISLNKMVVLAAKFTILIPWSIICILLILLSASMKLASTLARIMYNSIESERPRWTPRIRVKGLYGRPFILILDWMLVYPTSIMWMNLFPYPNFCKAEKIKFQWKSNQSNSKGFEKILINIYYTERFLFGLLGTSIVSRINRLFYCSIFNSSWLVFTYYYI